MSATAEVREKTEAPAGFREMMTRNMRQSGILIAFIVVVGISAVLNPNFLSPGNLTNLVLQLSLIHISTTSSRPVTTERHHWRLMFSLSSTPKGP